MVPPLPRSPPRFGGIPEGYTGYRGAGCSPTKDPPYPCTPRTTQQSEPTRVTSTPRRAMMSEEGQLTVDEVISAFGDGQPRRPRCPRKGRTAPRSAGVPGWQPPPSRGTGHAIRDQLLRRLRREPVVLQPCVDVRFALALLPLGAEPVLQPVDSTVPQHRRRPLHLTGSLSGDGLALLQRSGDAISMLGTLA